jgi:hypothetical protein
MKSRSLLDSRALHLSLRMSATLVIVAALTLGTGCSWFKRKPKDTDVVPMPTPIAQVSPTPTPSPGIVPPDNPRTVGRPSESVPLPEMRVIYFDYDKSEIRPDQLEAMRANLPSVISTSPTAFRANA